MSGWPYDTIMNGRLNTPACYRLGTSGALSGISMNRWYFIFLLDKQKRIA
ncbi:MAG: hypothetical protein L3J18_00855 [Candidatus Brocadia sp.]|nr:hypothetical protein [Candidatus Brocadia sp.]UJS20907.1 MAG: hypothetical protein L3J18_00855 [Candidatus Brocadia sp.]